MINQRLVFTVGVCAVLALSACSRTTSTSLVRTSDTVVERAYTNPNADFSKYSRLMTEGLEIYYPTDIDEPASADLERIRHSFRQAFTEAIGGEYLIVDKPGPDVLLVRAQLIDTKVTGSRGAYEGGGLLRTLVAKGELTFIMEMVDSMTGEVLMRAADRTHDVKDGKRVAGWSEVDAAAEYWAGLFRDWFDRSLRQ